MSAQPLRGPLTGLSFRHTNPAANKKSVPQPPTNEERYRALLAVLPLTTRNAQTWPFASTPVCLVEAKEA